MKVHLPYCPLTHWIGYILTPWSQGLFLSIKTYAFELKSQYGSTPIFMTVICVKFDEDAHNLVYCVHEVKE